MRDLSDMYTLLRKEGISISGPIVSSFEDDCNLYIFVKMKLDEHGRQIPSPHKLNSLRSHSAAQDYTLHFILIGEKKTHVDRSLKTMLFGKFPNDVRNSFAAVNDGAVDVWVEPKHVLSGEEEAAIRTAVVEFINILALDCSSVKVTQAEPIPTRTAILRTLRIAAPASLHVLATALRKQDLSVPNEIWLNHTLDGLRKTGFVIRRTDGQYLLSLHALSVLGTRKGRRSPDVQRALALGRRH